MLVHLISIKSYPEFEFIERSSFFEFLISWVLNLRIFSDGTFLFFELLNINRKLYLQLLQFILIDKFCGRE